MFTEILRVKPVLDSGSASQMERSLHGRFARVAKTFGGGLRAIIKGSFLGISLALINRILNPLEAVEEKIKKLLGEGTDIQDMAERLGTSPGQLRQLQDVAKSLGVPTDKLNEALTKFAESVETARTELKDASQPRSSATQVLRETIGEQGIAQGDLAESFLTFIRALKKEGASGGRIVEGPLGAIGRTGQESRQAFEKEVLGAAQFGGVKRLIDADFGKQAVRIHEPSVQQLNRAVKQTGDAAKIQRELETQNDTQDFLRSASLLNQQMIKDMEAARATEQSRLSDQLKSYENLRRGADAVEDIKQGMTNLLSNVTDMIGMLKEITAFIPKITNQRWWNGILGGRGE